MAKLPRVTNKRFGSDVELDNIGQFGSAAAGEKTNTKDVAEIQALDAWKQGWTKATMSSNKYPTMQERNGLDYVHAYQIDYLLREGIAEYDSQTEYNTNSIVKGIVNNEMKLFSSVLDQNIGQDLTNENAWKELSFGGGGLEIGDIGIAPLGIDETKGKRRYLNGQIIIQEQYVQFTNKVKSAVALYPSLACTESEWQTTATMTVGGQVGKFVVDNDAGTIRLPKIIMPIQGLTDLSKLAEIVEAGLPNITGATAHVYQYKPTGPGSGAFIYDNAGGGVAFGSSSNTGSGVGLFDASRSNPIYGNSDTVQQEQIQYPYFIQVATGAETEDNIINEIELNNPFFLGMSQYFESEPNNISWLKSAGQWNAKAVYPTVYDWVLINANNGIEGFKFITDEYTDYDYVLNTAEETFRLPLLDGSESLPSDKYEDLTLKVSGSTYIAPANGWYALNKVGNSSQFIRLMKDGVILASDIATSANQLLGVSLFGNRNEEVILDYNAGGDTYYFRFIYAQGNGSLYFYVGETVQNANLINAGRIEEKVASLIPDNSSLISGYGMPSGRYIDLTLGASGTTYTAPATGWVLLSKNTGSSQTDGNIIIAVGACEWRTFCTLHATSAQINVPVAKGQSFKITYNLSGTTGRFRFVYAQGEK